MGIYDTLYVDCPGCGQQHSFQSKAGPDPYLHHFTIENAPRSILGDVADQLEGEPATCACGTVYTLKITAAIELKESSPPAGESNPAGDAGSKE